MRQQDIDKIKKKIADLDAEMALINKQIDERGLQDGDTERVMSIAHLTNKYLRMIGADESEMYAD